MYDSNAEQRPDLTIQTHASALAIDVALVQSKEKFMDQANKYAEIKRRTHQGTVTAYQHQFRPMIFEGIGGHFHKSVFQVIKLLQAELAVHLRRDFKNEVIATLSNALARGRAETIFSLARTAGLACMRAV